MFDLYLLPIHQIDGADQTDLPGILLTVAPRRAERSRTNDVLMVMLTQEGNAPLSRASLNELLQGASDVYYKTRGPATAGLRAMVEYLNEQLFNRNNRLGREGLQTYAIANLAVLRRDQLLLAIVGPTHSFILSPNQAEDFCALESPGRGLGAGRTADLLFFQAQVQSGDLVVFCPKPPPSWTAESLSTGTKLSLEHLRRRLLNQSGGNLAAAVIQFRSGSGQVRLLRPRAASTREPAPESFQPPVPPPISPAQPALPTHPPPQPEIKPAQPEPVAPPEQSQPSASTSAVPLRKTIPWRQRLASIWFGSRRALQGAAHATRDFFKRLLPASAEPARNLSPASMLFIAVAVPLVVVAVAVTVYYYAPGGRSEQHLIYLQQAQGFADQALAQKDRVLQRNAWQQSLYWLDKADQYGQSEDSRNLRRQVRQALDVMDGITRLSFLPAISGDFAQNVNFSRLVATATEIYALDSTQGRVFRLFQVGQGYEIDTQFQCNPGPSGSILVGPLIDLALLPLNNTFKATVMAIDGAGNVLFCIPGSPALGITLPPPEPFWGDIHGIALDQDILYVLDRKNNRVWLYVAKELSFPEAPRLFFNEQVPVLSDVVDMAVSGEDLYLLHQNGRMTLCTFRTFSFSDTKCSDPAKYTDPRSGKAQKITEFPDVTFSQLVTTRPPDPSVFVLDAGSATFYHFSLRLNLVRLLSPLPQDEYPIPIEAATAFTIDANNRLAVLAFGNRIFYAEMP